MPLQDAAGGDGRSALARVSCRAITCRGRSCKIEVYRRLSRIRKLDRLDDFRQELRDRFGPIPTPAEWLLRLAELRILASHWQIATVHLEGKWEHPAGSAEPQEISAIGPVDLVLGYRQPRKVERLVKQSEDRLKIVDGQSAYLRLRPEEYQPLRLFERIKHLLRLPDRPL